MKAKVPGVSQPNYDLCSFTIASSQPLPAATCLVRQALWHKISEGLIWGQMEGLNIVAMCFLPSIDTPCRSKYQWQFIFNSFCPFSSFHFFFFLIEDKTAFVWNTDFGITGGAPCLTVNMKLLIFLIFFAAHLYRYDYMIEGSRKSSDSYKFTMEFFETPFHLTLRHLVGIPHEVIDRRQDDKDVLVVFLKRLQAECWKHYLSQPS